MLQKYRTLAQIYENCNIVQRFFDFFRDVPRETLGFEAENGPNNKWTHLAGDRFVRGFPKKI